MALMAFSTALAALAPIIFWGVNVETSPASTVINRLEANGARRLVKEPVILAPSEKTGNPNDDAWQLKLKQFKSDLEWLDTQAYEIRLRAPPQNPEIDYAKISWCPPTDAVAGITVKYRKEASSVDQYARLTTGISHELAVGPISIDLQDDGSMFTVWRLPSTASVVASWNPSLQLITVSRSVTSDAALCHLKFATAKARSEALK